MLLPLLFLFAAPPTTADLDSALKRFTELLSIVQTNAADPVATQQAIYQGAIPGMLRTLDPHSIFFDPDQNEQLKQMENSERKGFGTVVSVLPGRVIVLQAQPGTPSAKAGLQPGDEIVAVNGVALARLEFDQVIGYLGESHQHRAQLIVRRPGNARPLPFVLDPELLDSPSVDRAYLLRPGIGYIRVTGFDPQTARQLKDGHRKPGWRQAERAGSGFARQSRRRGADCARSRVVFSAAGPKDPQRERPESRGSIGGGSEDRGAFRFSPGGAGE